jgi:hypothetical protein
MNTGLSHLHLLTEWLFSVGGEHAWLSAALLLTCVIMLGIWLAAWAIESAMHRSWDAKRRRDLEALIERKPPCAPGPASARRRVS